MNAKKRISVIILAVCLTITMMPMIGQTGNVHADSLVSYSYVLDGVTYSSSGGTGLDGNKVSYDASTSTLTLNNASITKATFHLPDSSVIKFTGRNTVLGNDSDPVFWENSPITLTGFTLEGSKNSYLFIDGYTKSAMDSDTSIVVNSGTVYAKSTSAAAMSCGGGLTVNGGSVTAVSDTSEGIISYNFTLNGGTVIAKGSTFGIKTGGDARVNGGALYASGKNPAIGYTLPNGNPGANALQTSSATITPSNNVIIMTNAQKTSAVAYNDTATPVPDVWLCGFPVIYNNLAGYGDYGNDGSSYTWIAASSGEEASGNSIILNGFTGIYDGGSQKCISSDSGLAIGLLGDNLIDASANTYVLNNSMSYGIYSGGRVMFNYREGLTGNLNITAPQTFGTSSGSTGIYAAGKFSIYSGALSVYGTSCGIESATGATIMYSSVSAYAYNGAAWKLNSLPVYNSGFTPQVFYGADPSTGTYAVSPALSVYTGNRYVRIRDYTEAPVIITEPSGGAYTAGGTAAPLTITTNDPGSTYQWQQSKDGVTWTNISGATGTSYTPSAASAGTYQYRCVITGSSGKTTVSNVSTVTVKSAIPANGTAVTKSGIRYKVTKSPASISLAGTAMITRETIKHKTFTVPSGIYINKCRFNITGIYAKAFYKDTKLKSLSIGANVTTIGKQACYKCKNLKTVTIKTKKLKSIGKSAFKGCSKGMTFKITKSKYSKYTKMLKKSGLPSGTKFKKI